MRSLSIFLLVSAAALPANATVLLSTAHHGQYFGSLANADTEDMVVHSWSVAELARNADESYSQGVSGATRSSEDDVDRTTLSSITNAQSVAHGGKIFMRWLGLNTPALKTPALKTPALLKPNVEDRLAVDEFSRNASDSFLQPIPEPNSWVLLIAGFMLLGAAARRRHHVRRAVA